MKRLILSLVAVCSMASAAEVEAPSELRESLDAISAALYLCYIPGVYKQALTSYPDDWRVAQRLNDDCLTARQIGFTIDITVNAGALTIARLQNALELAKALKPNIIQRRAVYDVQLHDGTYVHLTFVHVGSSWLIAQL